MKVRKKYVAKRLHYPMSKEQKDKNALTVMTDKIKRLEMMKVKITQRKDEVSVARVTKKRLHSDVYGDSEDAFKTPPKGNKRFLKADSGSKSTVKKLANLSVTEPKADVALTRP